MQNDEVLMLFPRSSSPKKQGIMFPHSVGIIDADYYGNIDNDGHIMIQCINIKDEDVVIKKGEAIAQAMFKKFLVTDDDCAEGERVGGFGSTSKYFFDREKGFGYTQLGTCPCCAFCTNGERFI